MSMIPDKVFHHGTGSIGDAAPTVNLLVWDGFLYSLLSAPDTAEQAPDVVLLLLATNHRGAIRRQCITLARYHCERPWQ